MLELFAGQARITRLGKACGISCEAHDWDFDKDAKSSKGSLNNAFDITGPAGLVILSVDIITGFGVYNGIQFFVGLYLWPFLFSFDSRREFSSLANSPRPG